MLELETQSPPPPPPPSNWLVAHPYTASTMGAVFLFLVGSYIVFSKSLSSPPPPSVSAWGGTLGSVLNQNQYEQESTRSPEDILQKVQDSPPYNYKIPPLNPDPAVPGQTPQDNGLDLEAFITALSDSQSQVGAPPPKWDNVLYEFPPSNIFSATEAPAARTELQQKLYNYGNEVGSYILSYEQQNRNQTTVLKDQIEDRDDPEKAEAVVQIGRALQNVATNMRGIDDVPSHIASAHQALMDSYTEIGHNLTLVPEAKDTAAFLNAINTYNASADAFAKKFVDMVQIFSKYDVVFSTADAGSIFTFTFTVDE
jgi:hypothetical protein